MRVSVVMPVYNKGPFLREAIDSILGQSYTALELICVDDKSTDNSLDILRSISDPRLRIVEQTVNGGPGIAANAGLDAARGEYVVRMDADDISVRDRIAHQVEFMDRQPELIASGGQLSLFGTEREKWTYPLNSAACAAQLLFGVPVAQPASILRRSVLHTHGLRYDPAWPRIGEDWLFWLRLAPFGPMANLPQVLVHYRRGPQNIGHGTDKVVNFRPLQAAALDAFHIPYTAEDLEVMLSGLMLFSAPPTAGSIRALRSWYGKLLAMNAQRVFAPEPAFSQRVDEQWNKLFHYLPQYGWGPALAHLFASSSFSLPNFIFALKYRVNAILGRLPSR